jgi:hypothetical protein
MIRSRQVLMVAAVCIATAGYGAWHFSRSAVPVGEGGGTRRVADVRENPTFAVPPPSVRTVSWYMAHRPEMNAKVEACKDNPGGALSDPDCENAGQADLRIGLDTLRSQLGAQSSTPPHRP